MLSNFILLFEIGQLLVESEDEINEKSKHRKIELEREGGRDRKCTCVCVSQYKGETYSSASRNLLLRSSLTV